MEERQRNQKTAISSQAKDDDIKEEAVTVDQERMFGDILIMYLYNQASVFIEKTRKEKNSHKMTGN